MQMDVDAAALQRLLDLQAEDVAINRLEDRKESLPEAARLAEVRDTLAELTSDLEIARKQSGEIDREQNKLEGEIGLLDEKIAREEQRLFSGAVSNPKELGALKAEVEMLKRQKEGLEDQLLEVMVQKDEASTTLTRLTAEHSSADADAARLTETVGGLTAELETELAQRRTERDSIAGEIPDQLIQLYEKIRAQKHGVGAAALVGGTCEGCHTSLPSREVERMKREGGLQRCENCRRILVVT